MTEKLSARVEKATGADRELDRDIAPCVGLRAVDEGHPFGWCYYDERGHGVPLPSFTSSLDAALTLVPPDAFCRVGHDGEGPDPALFRADVLQTPGSGLNQSRAATPALALTAAALKARSL